MIMAQPQEPPPNLKTTRTDIGASIARGVLGACPVIGNLLSEAISHFIPNQKTDRIVKWVELLDQRVAAAEDGLSRFGERLHTEAGSDLFEESATQASRALSDEKRVYIANLFSRSLTQEELKYAESKKMLNILRDLTDPEIIILTYYAKPPTMGSQWHRDMVSRYPETLRPVSRTLGSSQSQIDLSALQDSYRQTLLRLDLLQQDRNSLSLSPLGSLLLRYILPPAH